MNGIKRLRVEKSMSQEELAMKLKVSQQAITKWETGEANPRADKLPLLAQVLECSIDELFQDDRGQAADN